MAPWSTRELVFLVCCVMAGGYGIITGVVRLSALGLSACSHDEEHVRCAADCLAKGFEPADCKELCQ